MTHWITFRSNADFRNSRMHHQTWFVSFFHFVIRLVFTHVLGHCCVHSARHNCQFCFSRRRRIQCSSCIRHRVIYWCQNQGSCFIYGLIFRRKRRCFRSSGASRICQCHRKVCVCICSVRGTSQITLFFTNQLRLMQSC
jgi:hypothetical protein